MIIFHKKPDFNKEAQKFVEEFLEKENCESEIKWINRFKLETKCSEEFAVKTLSRKLDLYVRLRELDFDEYVSKFIEIITDTDCFAANDEFEYIPSFKKELKDYFQEIKVILFDENNNQFYIDGVHNYNSVTKLYKTFKQEISDRIKKLLSFNKKDQKIYAEVGEEISTIWKNNSLNDPFLDRLNLVLKEG